MTNDVVVSLDITPSLIYPSVVRGTPINRVNTHHPTAYDRFSLSTACVYGYCSGDARTKRENARAYEYPVMVIVSLN